MNLNLVWTCKCCGKQHNTLPMAFAVGQPDRWQTVPEPEREKRGELSSDACVIDEKEFYLRARIVVPVIGSKYPFVWGIWVSLAQNNFERIGELWDVEIRENEPPFFGFLANDISIYPQTLNLKCRVHLKNAGERPLIELEPTGHPLAGEQRDGISLHRVMEIAAALLQH